MSEKLQEEALVVSQKKIGDGIYDLTLQTNRIASIAKAGQFVSVYSNDASRILPRPISLCGIDAKNETIRLVYRVVGKGTQEFSRLGSGDTLQILGPLGNGFTLNRKKAFLIGGGIGIPPMLELAKKMNAEMPEVDKTIVLGYRDKGTFLLEEFQKQGNVVIATEDGSVGTQGNVLDAIRQEGLEADVMYACGPAPMLGALKNYAIEKNMDCYISMEERMACGIGACLACVCRTKETDAHSNVKNTRICKEGPVFDAREVEL